MPNSSRRPSKLRGDGVDGGRPIQSGVTQPPRLHPMNQMKWQVRDRDNVRFVTQRPCLICGRLPADPPISDLRKAARLAARSAMSSPFPSVAVTIVKSIAAAMKRHGGKISVSIRRLQPDPVGSKATHCRWGRRDQRPTYDRDPTANCRRHHLCKVRLAIEEYRRRLERTKLNDVAASQFVGLD